MTNLIIIISGPSSLTISWDPPLTPNGNLTYDISLSFTDLATNVTEMVLQTQTIENNRTLIFNSSEILEPYAEYQVEVVAFTSVDRSSPETDTVTTAQGG